MLSPWKVWEPTRGGTGYLGISPSLYHNAPARYTERRTDSLSPSRVSLGPQSHPLLLSVLFPRDRVLSPASFCFFVPFFSQSIRLLYAKLRRPSVAHAEHGTALYVCMFKSTYKYAREAGYRLVILQKKIEVFLILNSYCKI